MATQFENGLTLSELAERNAELVTEVEKLRAERDASLNAERVWEKTMMEVCGEDGPASVAAAFKQLAAENVALKQFPEQIIQFISGLGTSEIGSDTKEKIGLAASRIKAPATDRIVAEAEARGVEKFAKKLESRGRHQDYVAIANAFAKQLREGAK
ncbi:MULTISPECIES: hypothetical protein [Klebsiella pneumoniae complex]|uniref:hypothetical protein n=1 Tax=Klebsiella pneumoniae complex TaxID=3390273 RepID=UPI001651CC1A|nr:MULTISPECIES: hypothetical protein [Klebsiella]